jgi:hypothetical protein
LPLATADEHDRRASSEQKHDAYGRRFGRGVYWVGHIDRIDGVDHVNHIDRVIRIDHTHRNYLQQLGWRRVSL